MSRILPLCFLTALVGLTGCGSPAEESTSTGEQDLTSGAPYLALGDSVAFGYNPVDAVNDPKNLNAFVGYPEITTLAGHLSPTPVANAACAGETSGSFLDTRAPDNGCQAWRAAGDAMHVQYASTTEPQIQFALSYLAAHPTTATVTLGIGANDLLLAEYACQGAFNPATDPNYIADVTACEEAKIPTTIATAAGNIGTIAGAIRQSGYKGQLVLVTYYAPQYTNPADPNLQSVVGLGEAMVQVAQGYPQLGLSIAKGFSAFAAVATKLGGGDSCKAGLLYKLADGTCDKHPSKAGQAVLAAAVATAVPASQINLAAATPQF